MSGTTSNRELIVTNIVWWIVMSMIHYFIITNENLTVTEKITDSIVSYGLLAFMSLLIINNMRYYLPKQEKYLYVIIVSLVITGIWLWFSKFILNLIFRSDVNYLNYQGNTSGLRFGISFLSFACLSFVSLLWYAQEDQKKLNAHTAETQQLAKEAELFKLRQQLQPHFLFNSLNSISALTGSRPEEARRMINQLSEFLRGTLKKDEKQWNTLDEELQYLQLYLDIEKVRFGYRLQTNILCDEEALTLQLPAMLLQPIVENAIKFGLYDTTGEVCIKVAAKKLQNSLEVIVENPFDPETAQPLKGTGFGLSSIQRRLFLLFARQDLLKTTKEENRFITTILIPQKNTA
ncbi:MAG: histidine kinase [Parafilimonas sp.]